VLCSVKGVLSRRGLRDRNVLMKKTEKKATLLKHSAEKNTGRTTNLEDGKGTSQKGGCEVTLEDFTDGGQPYREK